MNSTKTRGDRIGVTWTVICLVFAAGLSWPALSALFGPDPVRLPDYIRAAEGEVMVPTDARPGAPYELRLRDGRVLVLHCAPLAATRPRPCLEDGLGRLGLAAGRPYRLTVSYGAEHTKGGQMRNVLVHALLDDSVLFSPDEQLWSWRRRNAMLDQMSDPDFLFLPGLLAMVGFWGVFQLIEDMETKARRRRRAETLSRRWPDPG
ncbi:hypothetical protein DDF62_02395 [Caulobacter radicis]|uniref:hypothetical protein n=1 Tax=Caulobacter radicis TaxID=2172650 RepID=UPI000D578A81|nr:hypothetical protein [Caulobacter radicis]PVM92869.1 hypothetical protein DDF62_02395 [Caulobacter radicis]